MSLQINELPADRRAHGRRKLSGQSVTHAAAAKAYPGLPDGVTRPFELLATLKRARSALGVPPALIEFLDLLFAYTEAQDWQAGARPMVWPSNRLLGHQLSLTASGVKKRIRLGIEFGVFVMRDSANGHRRGLRGKDGRLDLDHTYGFDLSPMARRHAEFHAAAACDHAAYKAQQAMRRRGYRAKSALMQMVETADAEGLWASFWDQLESQIPALFEALAEAEGMVALAEVVLRLESLKAEAEAVLTNALNDKAKRHAEDVESDPMGCPQGTQYNYTNPIPLAEATGTACQEVDSAGGVLNTPAQSAVVAPVVQERSDFEDRVYPEILTQSVPEIAARCPSPFAVWREIIEAARGLCLEHGVSQRVWGRACQALTSTGAALAMAVMLHQHGRNPLRSPGGYFFRMIERAERGQLDLMRSYHGMRVRLTKH